MTQVQGVCLTGLVGDLWNWNAGLAELVSDFLELAGHMGDPRKHIGTWPVWGSEAHVELRDMGCSVWPARCRIVDCNFL